MRHLCQDWFPIDYPDSWYKDITSDPRFYSLAAIYDGVIIGLVVAEIKAYAKLNREVSYTSMRGAPNEGLCVPLCVLVSHPVSSDFFSIAKRTLTHFKPIFRVLILWDTVFIYFFQIFLT